MENVKVKEKVDEFVASVGMKANDIDIPYYIDEFLAEMNIGLGGKGSLYMVPTYIGKIDRIQYNHPVAVLDVGGSNLRAAVVTFVEEKGAVVTDYVVCPMPGIDREITRDEFFSSVADALESVVDQSDVVSVCFSFGTIPLQNKDGQILEIGKQLKVKGLVGCKVGECIQHELSRRGYRQKRFLVLNDSAAVLLGGMALHTGDEYGDFIGFVLGTGTNICYYEQTQNIIKDKAMEIGRQMIVNIESGAFDRLPRSQPDLALDAKLNDTGNWLLEKMVSGRYQGELLLETLQHAAGHGLFSPFFTKKLEEVNNLEGAEIDAFLDTPDGTGRLAQYCSENAAFCDRETLFYLIHNQMDRSARILTVTLGATLSKVMEYSRRDHKVCIATEGSTLFRSRILLDKLKFYMNLFVSDGMGISYEFVKAEKSTIVGSAIASFAE